VLNWRDRRTDLYEVRLKEIDQRVVERGALIATQADRR
jgi:hypothetical protein